MFRSLSGIAAAQVTSARNPNGGDNVQKPTASRITQTLSSHAINSSNFSTCTGRQAGWYRRVQKIVTDQNGADIVLNLQDLTETVTIGTPNQLNITGVQKGTAKTDVNGEFVDTFFVCSSQCPGSGALWVRVLDR